MFLWLLYLKSIHMMDVSNTLQVFLHVFGIYCIYTRELHIYVRVMLHLFIT